MRIKLSKLRLALSASVLTVGIGVLPTAANAATCNWLTAAGNWATGGNWSCGAQPTSVDDAVITTPGAVVSVSGITASTGTLNLAAGNALNITGGSSFYIYNGGLTDNGTITISNNSELRNLGSAITVGGTGSIVLDNSTNVAYLYSGSWTFGSGFTVAGAGSMGLNQTVFTNNGLISANVGGRTLAFDVSGGASGLGGNGVGNGGNAGLYNTGTIQATGGGTLALGSGQYENSATGVIKALAGSSVLLGDDVRIVGGTLTSVGTGAVNTSGGTQYLNGVTLSGGSALKLSGSTTFLEGQFTNNGTVTIDGSTDLRGNGAVTINGSGSMAFGATGNNRLFGGSITFASNQNFSGTGQLGANQTVFTNNAVFTENGGGTLSIDVTNGSGGLGGNGVGTGGNAGLYNTGTMQATGGSNLSFGSGQYENSVTGVISAGAGSTVTLTDDARIVGGTLTSVGSGAINTANGNEYLSNVALSNGSHLNVTASNTLLLDTTFTNNGTVTVNNASDLRNQNGGTLTINGTGTIILGAAGNNRLFGGNISFGAGQTVQGAGQLGINQTTFTINNVFSADAGSVLSIDVTNGSGGLGGNGVGTGGNAGLYNTSTMQATGGSSLNFESGQYENSATGVIQALAGSTVNLDDDVRIVNGTLTSVGTGAINTTNGNEYLSNVTLSSGSHLNVTASNTLYLDTAFTNNGTVTINNSSDLRNQNAGTLTITGTGAIVLGTTGSNRILGGNIVFGSNQAVSGTGQLGANQTTITNNNTFSVGSGGALAIDVTNGSGGLGGNGVGTNGNAGLFNNGAIEATGGSTVSFASGNYENAAAGVIRAIGAGSSIALNDDARIVNGTLTSSGGGAINTGNGNEYLSNVTLSSGSNLNIASANTVFLNTLFTNNGSVLLDANSDLRSETGTLTIGGTGTITLGTNPNNRIYGGTITFGAGQTVQGTGQIGANTTIFTNNNIINANVAGKNLSIDSTNGSGGLGGNGLGANGNAGVFNANLIEATGGGTVSFESGNYENGVNGVILAGSGSAVNLDDDSRIVNGTLTSSGTGTINALNGNEYLTNVTLSAGSNLNIASANTVFLNTLFTNNGNVLLDANSDLRDETGTLTIGGTGTITLGTTNNNRVFGGNITIGAGQTLQGTGEFGINQTIMTNNGTISANVAGRTLSIDSINGSGGLGGNGVGVNGNSGFVNNDLVQAVDGGTIAFQSGRYENGLIGLGGELFASSGGTIVFNDDANFANLETGGVLDGGRLYAQGYNSTTSTINLRATGANSIVTIGGGSDTTAEVILQGAGSVIEVTPFGGGTPTTIDQSLQAVAQNGVFALQDRDFTVQANAGAFSNAGLTFVNNTVFTASSFANSGTLISDSASSVVSPIANTGLVHVASGTLTSQAITGLSGAITIDAGATLSLGASSTTGILTDNGTLALGSNSILVDNDYQNANFGSGNAFAAHNGVTGSGTINAVGATMDVTGTALSGGTLNVGNVRTGGSSSTNLTVTNNGAETILRGAVQNGSAPSVALSGQDFVLNPGGGSTTIMVSYTGLTAGSLSGQSLNVVNNFDNVANRTIQLAGNVYQVAQAGAEPTTLTLGARRVGDAAASTTLTIANVAPVTPGFNEALTSSASVAGGFLLNGASSASVNNLAAGSSSAITLTHGTGTSGAFTSTVSIGNTSIAVAGSGLANLALAGQSVQVSENIYAAAVAGLSSNTVNFGTVRAGASPLTGGVSITNNASGALTDSLVTAIGATPSMVTTTATPGALAAGQSGNATFSASAATAGQISGSTTLGFTSHDSQLADLTLASQNVSFTGTVTDVAVAALTKNSGIGTFSGSGNAYVLNLGTLTSNSGSFTIDIGVLNSVLLSSYSESLGGSFAASSATGYSFSGAAFSGLGGGSTDTGNFLTFNTNSLGSGTYNDTLTFSGFSSYPSLADLTLGPISLNVTAAVNAATGGGAVPEPSSWAMMIAGFGLVGATLRRRRTVATSLETAC